MRPPETPKDMMAHGGDDLEAIEGISRNYAALLRSTGIERFADFGRYDPVMLSKTIQQSAGVNIPAEIIQKEDWIGQARLLSEKRTNSVAQEVKSCGGWEERSSFMVFFDRREDADGKEVWRVKVYDNRSGEEETAERIETAGWLDWILRRANLPDSTLSVIRNQAAPVFSSPETIGDFCVDLKRVRVSEPRQKRPPGEIRLEIEVSFALSGLSAMKISNRQVPCRLEFYAVDRSSESCQLLASFQERLLPNKLAYDVREMIPMPHSDSSELYTVLFFLPPVGCMVLHRGPVIKRIRES